MNGRSHKWFQDENSSIHGFSFSLKNNPQCNIHDVLLFRCLSTDHKWERTTKRYARNNSISDSIIDSLVYINQQIRRLNHASTFKPSLWTRQLQKNRIPSIYLWRLLPLYWLSWLRKYKPMGNGPDIFGTYAYKHWLLDSIRFKKKSLEILHIITISKNLPRGKTNA